MIIYGAYRPQRILASKWEEYPRCGVIGVHGIRRHATWIHIFWVPLLLLWDLGIPIWLGGYVALIGLIVVVVVTR